MYGSVCIIRPEWNESPTHTGMVTKLWLIQPLLIDWRLHHKDTVLVHVEVIFSIFNIPDFNKTSNRDVMN